MKKYNLTDDGKERLFETLLLMDSVNDINCTLGSDYTIIKWSRLTLVAKVALLLSDGFKYLRLHDISTSRLTWLHMHVKLKISVVDSMFLKCESSNFDIFIWRSRKNLLLQN